MNHGARKTALLFFLLLSGVAATSRLGGAGAMRPAGLLSAVRTPAPAPWLSPGLSVYFSDPAGGGFRGGPEEALIEAVEEARLQVDVAAYDLDLWGLRDAMLDAHRRGVAVRLVVEADHLHEPEVEALVEGGIPVSPDRPDGLMHDKFIIIDRRQVWTGSMNFTLHGAYVNDNNLAAITSPAAAAAYEGEFEEMFVEGLYGAYSPPGEPVQIEIVGPGGTAIRVEIYFSPDDGVEARIVELIDAAQRSVRFMAFSFTSDAIGEAMLERAAAGVLVQGVFDESQLRSNRGSEYEGMLGAGLDVRVDGSPGKLHHKVIVLDGRIVILGSYNFSLSAETRNDENMLVIHDESIAAAFEAEWQRLFELGR